MLNDCISWKKFVHPSCFKILLFVIVHYIHNSWPEDVPTMTGLHKDYMLHLSFPGNSVVKNLPIMKETQVQSLGREDPLEKEMATHSSILAWKIPWTEEPGGLQPMGYKESDMT